MSNKIYKYPITVQETYLDVFGHMNHAKYLTVLEEARWDLITHNGYGLEKIFETQKGPVILEVKLEFLKELRLRDEIIIETQLISWERKIGKMAQRMMRGSEVCAKAEFLFGLFNMKERKLEFPTPEWLKGMGLESDQRF